MATTEPVPVERALQLGQDQPPLEVDRLRRAASLPKFRQAEVQSGPWAVSSAGKIDAANLDQWVRHVGDAGHKPPAFCTGPTLRECPNESAL
jgi:hypothetical protein